MAIDNEPKALVADILSEIISYVKASRPTRTDGSSTQGYVYSQIRPGQMISPRDFSKPWSPIGGAGASSAPAPGATPAAGSTTPPLSSSDITRRAMRAAFNTTQLVDTMMIVTNDSTMETYSGGGRHLGVTYEQILNAMEAPPAPDRAPEITARLNAARNVLWDADGNATKPYARYNVNQKAYAKSVGDFTIAQNKTLADPAQADSWPVLAGTFQTVVDQALDKWRSQGADEIEAALATVESLGVPLEQGMIANARKLMEGWKVNIAGVAVKTPYSFILPSEWASLDVDDIGWTQVTKDRSTYQNHFDAHGYEVATGDWRGDSSSTGGSAGLDVFGFGFSGSHSENSSSASSDFSQTSSDGSHMINDATGLTVDLEYGMCEIMRPWLLTDLFRMRNWYLRGEKAGVISDGTITNQLGKEQPLLPMIPTHFLVIRNVKITAIHWGSVRDTLESQWAKQHSESEAHSSSTSGGVDIPVLGPFSVSAGFSRSDSHYQGDFKDESGSNCRDDYGSFFEGDTLCINGAQIVAWLGEIVPAGPPLADPALSAGTTTTPATSPTPAPV